MFKILIVDPNDPFRQSLKKVLMNRFMFKILIVDPNDPFRQSLKKVLMNRFPFIDIQEASDGNESRRVAKHSREDSPYSGINFILPGHIKCFF
jgi:CheY-like chemotaxis protein